MTPVLWTREGRGREREMNSKDKDSNKCPPKSLGGARGFRVSLPAASTCFPTTSTSTATSSVAAGSTETEGHGTRHSRYDPDIHYGVTWRGLQESG